jgi:CRP-like cAMP-binding protein
MNYLLSLHHPIAMPFTNIINHINRIVPLSDSEQALVKDYLQIQDVPKKKFILKPGEVCRGSWYVNKGCLRFYKIDDRGYEHILYFSLEDWWVGDLYSLFSKLPCDTYIEALEPCQLFFLERSAQQKLYDIVPKVERYFRIMLERNVIASQQISYGRMAATAVERYHNFQLRYPTLESRISQKHIASYIGVTPEFLSKMKHDLYKAKK